MMSKAREDYRTAVLALTEEYQVPVDAASEWRARVLTAGNRLDAAVLALMVECWRTIYHGKALGGLVQGDDKVWRDRHTPEEVAQALLKGEELEKPR